MDDRPDLELSEEDFALLEELPVCGCGIPDVIYELYRKVLTAARDFHEADGPWPESAVGDERLFFALAYVLDHIEATEHGGNVAGAWLTDKGRRLLGILDRYAESNYEAIPCMSAADDQKENE